MNIHNWLFFDKKGSNLNMVANSYIQLSFNNNDSTPVNPAEGYGITDYTKTLKYGKITNGGFNYNDDIITTVYYPFTDTNQLVNYTVPDASVVTKDVSIFNPSPNNSKSIDNVYFNISEPIEYIYPSATYAGALFLEPVSIGLIETEHLTILEKIDNSTFIFPYDNINSSLIVKFSGDESQINLFTVDENSQEITWVNELEIDCSNYLEIPLYLNIGFKSDEEGVFERILEIYHKVGETEYLLSQIVVNAQAIGFDERFKIHTDNFGLTDAKDIYKVFKESDINEDNIDYKLINAKQKEMILEYNNILPYIGTYKALINSLKWLGYDDISVKEWFLNVKENKKLSLDIPYQAKDRSKTLLLFSPEERQHLKKMNQLSLVYCLTRETGEIDDWGTPITENCYSYSIDEILVKLYALKQWLETNIIGVNSRIVDLTGEGVYYERYSNLVYATGTKGYDIEFKDSLTAKPVNISSELINGDSSIALTILELNNLTYNDLQLYYNQYIKYGWDPSSGETISLGDASINLLDLSTNLVLVGPSYKYPLCNINDIMWKVSVDKEDSVILGNEIVSEPLHIYENEILYVDKNKLMSSFYDVSTNVSIHIEEGVLRDASVLVWEDSNVWDIAFDGSMYKVENINDGSIYYSYNKPIFKPNNVNSEILWQDIIVGTNDGIVYRLNNVGNEIWYIGLGGVITSIIIDSLNNIIVAKQDLWANRIYVLNNTNGNDLGSYLNTYIINCLALQSDGKILVGHSNGILRLNTDYSIDNTFTNLFNEFNVTSIMVNQDDTFWIGTSIRKLNSTLYLVSKDGYTTIITPDIYFYETINCLAKQVDGKILAGTEQGVYRFNTDGSLDDSWNNPLPGNNIHSILIKIDGIYISYNGGAVLRLNTFGSVIDNPGIADYLYFNILINNNNKILCGSNQGLINIIDITNVDEENKLLGYTILSTITSQVNAIALLNNSNENITSSLTYNYNKNFDVPLLEFDNYKFLDSTNTYIPLNNYILDIKSGVIQFEKNNNTYKLNFSFDSSLNEQKIYLSIDYFSDRMPLYLYDPSIYYHLGHNDPSVLIYDNSTYNLPVNHTGNYNIELFGWDMYNNTYKSVYPHIYNVYTKYPNVYAYTSNITSKSLSSDISTLLNNNKLPIFDNTPNLQINTINKNIDGSTYINIPSLSYFLDIPNVGDKSKFLNLTELCTVVNKTSGDYVKFIQKFQKFYGGHTIKLILFNKTSNTILDEIDADILSSVGDILYLCEVGNTGNTNIIPQSWIDLYANNNIELTNISNYNIQIYVKENTLIPITSISLNDNQTTITTFYDYFEENQLVNLVIHDLINNKYFSSSYRVLNKNGNNYILDGSFPSFVINNINYNIYVKYAYSATVNNEMIITKVDELENGFNIYYDNEYKQLEYLDNTFTVSTEQFNKNYVLQQWYDASTDIGIIDSSLYGSLNSNTYDVSTFVLLKSEYDSSLYMKNMKNIWKLYKIEDNNTELLMKVYNDEVPFIFDASGTYNVEANTYDAYGNMKTSIREGLIKIK